MAEFEIDDGTVLFKTVHNAAKKLATVNILSEIIGSEDAINAKKINTATDEGKRGFYFIRIYRCLSAMYSGNTEHMRLWLTGYNAGTGGTPTEQIKDREGLITVMEYLEGMHYGKH